MRMLYSDYLHWQFYFSFHYSLCNRVCLFFYWNLNDQNETNTGPILQLRRPAMRGRETNRRRGEWGGTHCRRSSCAGGISPAGTAEAASRHSSGSPRRSAWLAAATWCVTLRGVLGRRSRYARATELIYTCVHCDETVSHGICFNNYNYNFAKLLG